MALDADEESESEDVELWLQRDAARRSACDKWLAGLTLLDISVGRI